MSTSREPPGAKYAALLQVLRTAESVWNASRLFFAHWDLSPSQFNVLNLLRDRAAGCTQIELSRALIMHRSNVTGLVDRLEARGLVRRTDMAGDRRAFLVRLAPAGRRLLATILPQYHAAAEVVWGRISAPHARELADELATLAANAAQMKFPER